MRKFILNADNFGYSKAVNKAVLEAYSSGLLKSVCVVPNGDFFNEAINDILPNCPDLGVGIQLNIVDGNSICEDSNSLINSDYKFCNSILDLIIKSYNPKEETFLNDVEREFRLQIEKVLVHTKITHISSCKNVHAIPKIFDIVCRLAKEYDIPYVRTHFEKPYIIPDLYKHLNRKYLKNILLAFTLGIVTSFNESKAHSCGIKTNDYLIGLLYDSLSDALTVAYGAIAVKYENVVVEAVIHPCRYDDGAINNNFDQYLLTKNKKLKEKIENLGYEITNYVKEEDL